MEPIPELIKEPRVELYTDPILYDSATSGAWGILSIFVLLTIILLAAVMIITWWKVFTKAGRPGWTSLIPFYNTFQLIEIAGKPGWWLIFFFIPILNIVFTFIVYHGISKVFGKGAGFTLGLYFLGIIFWPILAFGKAEYISPAPDKPTTPATPAAE